MLKSLKVICKIQSKFMMALSVSCLASACENASVLDESDTSGGAEETTIPLIDKGWGSKNCDWPEMQKIMYAHDILYKATTLELESLENCMKDAPLVEFSCASGQSAVRAVRSLLQSSSVLVYCNDLRGPHAQAYLNIKGFQLTFDRNYLRNSTPLQIAATYAHELVHNKGYEHTTYDTDSAYYWNTIPVQIAKCINSNYSESWKSEGPLSITYNDARCDGPKTTGRATQRRGMHACPLGFFMSGVHIKTNEFLCRRVSDYPYLEWQEFIDYSTQLNGVHNCPDGYAMTGLHKSKNQLLCAPIPIRLAHPYRYEDYDTQRAGMHSCPDDAVMTGFHDRLNTLTCQ